VFLERTHVCGNAICGWWITFQDFPCGAGHCEARRYAFPGPDSRRGAIRGRNWSSSERMSCVIIKKYIATILESADIYSRRPYPPDPLVLANTTPIATVFASLALWRPFATVRYSGQVSNQVTRPLDNFVCPTSSATRLVKPIAVSVELHDTPWTASSRSQPPPSCRSCPPQPL
jgi:hypothetical protein